MTFPVVLVVALGRGWDGMEGLGAVGGCVRCTRAETYLMGSHADARGFPLFADAKSAYLPGGPGAWGLGCSSGGNVIALAL